MMDTIANYLKLIVSRVDTSSQWMMTIVEVMDFIDGSGNSVLILDAIKKWNLEKL